MTMDWYIKNPQWWGDVSAALHPHPRISLIVHANDDAWLLENARLSNEDENNKSSELKFLIYGRTGWIGGLLGKLCDNQSINFEYGTGRLQDRRSIMDDVMRVRPTHVLNAAGVTGRPNVDWCESHKVETIRTNVVGTLNLADVCKDNNLLMINFATGCIFEYDKEHPQGSGIGFKEEDEPNFTGSFYSKTKAMVRKKQ